MKSIILIAFSIMSISCNSQVEKSNTDNMNALVQVEEGAQIGEYVLSAYEDSKGHLWFGTIARGIAKYDGHELKYFTKGDGFPSNRILSVVEDSEGVFWFSTGEGVSKLDGQVVTNFPVKENDWASNSISQLFIDSKGDFWVGTWGGVYKFNGIEFTAFPIPYPEVDTPINEDTKNWILEIKEDSEGNMWFTRDGYGISKYDGKSFTHILKKDGLHSNNVTEVEFDNKGNTWFGTRVAEKDNPDPDKRFGNGGVNKLVNGTMISFPEIEGFNDGDVFEIHKDGSDNLWISTVDNGVYKYDGNEFKNYPVPISIMNILDDEDGILWLAGAGGLYKINEKDEVINVTTEGPWK